MNYSRFGHTPRTHSQIMRSGGTLASLTSLTKQSSAAALANAGRHPEPIEFDEPDSGTSSGEQGWTVGYLDVLLLLVTLFAVLFGITYLQTGTTQLMLGQTPAGSNPAQFAPDTTSLPVATQTPMGAGGAIFPNAGTLGVNSSALNTPGTNLAANGAWATLPGAALPGTPFQGIYLRPGASMTDPGEISPWESNLDPGSGHPLLAFWNSTHVWQRARAISASERPAVAVPQNSATITASTIPLRESAELLPPNLVALLNWAQTGAQNRHFDAVIDPRQLRLEVGDAILFASGSADLSASGRQLIAELANHLPNTALTIDIEGHTDDVPINTTRFPSNWELSSLRAVTVARELVAQGVPESLLRVTGHADTRPRVPNDSAENRALNRRVSLVLRPTELPGVATTKPEQQISLRGHHPVDLL